MAPARSDSDTGWEEGEPEDSPDSADHGILKKRTANTETGSVNRGPRLTQHSENVPASKADIKNMLAEIKAFFSADIALVRQDLGTITTRLQSLEDEGRITRDLQGTMSAEIDRLKQITLNMEQKIAVLKDSKRQKTSQTQRSHTTSEGTSAQCSHHQGQKPCN
ncbi:Hypothetical predicted protein [Pelobates cultripes]|uniref:Uncharacterized protein n=1 Tax=Pelobates cultripes TaxID=61616 RepID=A0AAD1VSJ4_PELCU|nr:Hypothetical predicted protein [Pelobates cultripes]